MPKIKDSTRSIIAKAADGATLTDSEMTDLYCDAPDLLAQADCAAHALVALWNGAEAVRADIDATARLAREAGHVEQAKWMDGRVADLETALFAAKRMTNGMLGLPKEPTAFCGFPPNADGTVHGDLPDDAMGAQHSDQIKAAGYDVHCVRLDEDADAETAARWRPAPPRGDGWTLAWKAQDEDGWNAVWWRPTAQKRLEKLAAMVLGLGLVSSGGKAVKDYARECLGITTPLQPVPAKDSQGGWNWEHPNA